MSFFFFVKISNILQITKLESIIILDIHYILHFYALYCLLAVKKTHFWGSFLPLVLLLSFSSDCTQSKLVGRDVFFFFSFFPSGLRRPPPMSPDTLNVRLMLTAAANLLSDLIWWLRKMEKETFEKKKKKNHAFFFCLFFKCTLFTLSCSWLWSFVELDPSQIW